MKRKQRKQIINRLERAGDFHTDYLPQGKRYILPDADYKYVKTNVFYRASCLFWRTFTFLFGPLVCFFGFGLRVRGRSNLKGIKGAICVCNHVAVLDTLFVKQAVGHYRSYHTGAPHNNKKGVLGYVLRRAGFLSLGGGFGAKKQFALTLKQLLDRGAMVNFYPEEALWQRYEKPRPLQLGAFKYAQKFSVPIVPLFITFEGKCKHAVINILHPISPIGVTAEQMRDICFDKWKALYEKTYGKRLEYCTDIAEKAKENI